MRRRSVFLLLLLVAAGCSYGPVVDRSGVSSAVLLPGGEGVGFVYRVLRYRPAQGVAAFPDGGVPRYLDDRAIVAVVPLKGGPPRVLLRRENGGVSGSTSLSLRSSDADPGHVLVLLSEQPSTARPSALRLSRLRLADGERRPYPDIGADLAAKGRRLGTGEFGDVRVIASDGTLLIGAQGGDGPELWVWRPFGDYQRLDSLKHFYGVAGDELYYWSGDEARVKNWRTGAVRVVARYDPRIRQTSTLLRKDPTVAAVEAGSPIQSGVSWKDDAIVISPPDGRAYTVRIDVRDLRR